MLPAFAAALLTCAAASAPAGVVLDAPIVVAQVPRQTQSPPADWDPKGLVRSDWFDAARLILVSADGQLRVLSGGFHSACDPNVSFDGQRLLFAARKERTSRWRIWEMGLDGQGARPVSPESLEARSPIHVSTLFTLDSAQPWFTTVFVGREAALNEVGRRSVSSLYNVKLDGTELRRLTFNPNHNGDPFQMWDGRVIYSAERYPNEPGAGAGRVGLYAIHIEGADMELYGGELGGSIQGMPCATPGGLVVFVESDHPTWDGSGQLACVEEKRPHVTHRKLSSETSLAFLHPSPLRDNRVLVSRRATGSESTWGICSFDADDRQCEPVFDSPDFHDVQAVLIKPRNRPDGHSTVVTTTNDFGTFYGLNCYTADAMREAHVKTGEVKRVRFIEGVVRPEAESSRPAPALGPFLPRRLIGEAPVETDGSFNVVVPADTPLLLQTLDARGLALGNCGWIWVKPKEIRGCIGCHEDPEMIPENEYVLALRRPSNRLLLPPAQRRSVVFRQDIAPILRRHCATAECHGGEDTPLHLPLTGSPLTDRDLEAAYAALLAPRREKARKPDGLPQAGNYVDAGRARTSWLVWQLMGANTSRPWDQKEPPAETRSTKVRQMPPPGKGKPLSEVDLRTLVQWIDLGAPYESVKPSEPETRKVAEIK